MVALQVSTVGLVVMQKTFLISCKLLKMPRLEHWEGPCLDLQIKKLE